MKRLTLSRFSVPRILGAAGSILLVMTTCVLAQDSQALLKSVRFRFQPVIGGVQNVFIAGTFNDWNDQQDRLTDPDGDGIFETVLLLAPGRYEYKFVVDGKYLTDMNADEISGSGREGDNSVILVDDRFDAIQLARGDGDIQSRDLPLEMDTRMVNAGEDGRLTLSAAAYYPDIEHLRLHRLTENGPVSQDMTATEHDAAREYFQIDLPGQASKPLTFALEYQDGGTRLYATPTGLRDTLPDPADWYHYDPATFQSFRTPEWVRNGVFYQIFPERFCNGDKTNDSDFHERYYQGRTTLPKSGKTNKEYFHLVKDWDDIAGLSKSPYRTDGKPDYYSFYGGDIAGVTAKLPYLKDLGISILYFNPLNQGQSNHKYDPVDYLSIDPHFGTEAEFKDMVQQAHALGIRVIVDKAFNHTGDEHYAFVDTREKGEKSPYWSWYEWKKWPLPKEGAPTPCDYYSCWWDFPLHPNLNFDLSRTDNQENNIRDIRLAQPNWEVVDHILKVADYWIGNLDIDGFRLDVPNEVPFWMWELFRQRVDSLKSDAFLIGELWGDAMPWLSDKYFHSTMNYKYFREPVINFLALGKIDAQAFDLALTPGRHQYPLEATQAMMNLIGSHDTVRFLNQAGGNVDRLKLAALFQLCYMGVPAIYYGDEVALAGGSDPDNRRPFPWNWADDATRRDVHAHYQKLLALRNGHAALRTGAFHTLLAQDMTYVFLRRDDQEAFVVALNAGDSPATLSFSVDAALSGNCNEKFINALDGREWTANNSVLSLELKPYEGVVLKRVP